jgi:hypothetical protein
MSQSSAEILSPARTEIARGRPRAALKQLELARAALLANTDVDGLRELLELTRAVHTLAPVDAKARERLLAATGEGIESLGPGTSAPSGSTERVFAPARAEIERRNFGRALRRLEKDRRNLLYRGDVSGLGELIGLARRIAITKTRQENERKRLIDAAQQDVRYLDRGRAIATGEAWSDPFSLGKPKTELLSLPPMTRREKLISVVVVIVLAGAIVALALLDHFS